MQCRLAPCIVCQRRKGQGSFMWPVGTVPRWGAVHGQVQWDALCYLCSNICAALLHQCLLRKDTPQQPRVLLQDAFLRGGRLKSLLLLGCCGGKCQG